ncbi:uncharacterized protein LOC130629926 [Hydractinia symbiolongicarpus]|uniref:uncharacterized protein LOC130629926 n=1 Tax=Hydractinia symbiolongicarpus TaxID=13093 RepID=UPI00254EBC0D|nr:uncharacterized protein LOC130629926 [Hydractinia symbiolongicarpus]
MTTTCVCPQGQKRVNMEDSRECTHCKNYLSLNNLRIKGNGQRTKQCIRCLNIAIASQKRTKCPHQKRRSECKECKGSQICPYERQRKQCKECKGSQICPHKKLRYRCKECKGSQICPHQRRRSICGDYGGGSICRHQRVRSICRNCGGAGICHHQKQRRHCSIYDPSGHLACAVGSRIHNALKGNKELSSQEYLGCDIATLQSHIEA